MIPHVVFTPLRMICEGPIAEISNRVLRGWPKQKHRFVRVSFKEEDAKSSIRSVGKSTIRERVGKTITQGFTLQFMNMNYSFFVFSSGQLRGHKAWFFSEGPDLTCKQLRDWMGCFNHIFNVAMYSSRLGQVRTFLSYLLIIFSFDFWRPRSVRPYRALIQPLIFLMNGWNVFQMWKETGLFLAMELEQFHPKWPNWWQPSCQSNTFHPSSRSDSAELKVFSLLIRD